MSNTKLLSALALSLTGLAQLAEYLEGEALVEDNKESCERISKLVAKFRAEHGDTCKPAEVQNPSQAEVQSQDQAEVQNPCEAEKSLLEMLKDNRYTLRSFASIEEKTGLTSEAVSQFLEAEGIEFVVKYTSASEPLVGLASRN